MGIPYRFDPMGTLDTLGYVNDGLVFWLDCLAAGDGESVVLRERVSGIELPDAVNISGGICRSTLTVSTDIVPLDKSSVKAQELVSIIPDGRTDLGAAAVNINSYNAYSPVCGYSNDDRQVFWGKGANIHNIAHARHPEQNTLQTIHWPTAMTPPYMDGVAVSALSKEPQGAATGLKTIVNLKPGWAAVRVYNRELTYAEIMQNVAADAARYDKTIVYPIP